ncbi:hypothetical protein [Microseira wollei]|uniref:Uncharacterized protein n=1 Tax=Microseira wollei NIES-4236 TaxID=2530354 RepID=A0AAV3XJE5_9CYAN|nr:hypothetical protein [Microseira wollei]GET41641.1 hypothetical protein MiSe_64540 [Microseira wollei NIES-4236]
MLHRKINVKKGEKITVSVIDYRGQKPSMVTRNPIDRFIGTRRNTLVNAAIFIVDIVGRYDENGNPLNTEAQQLSWLSTNTETKIDNRKREHLSYINKGTLEIVFSVICSLNLITVKLVINKCDLDQLLNNQCLPNPTNLKCEEYAKQIFIDIEKEIKTACDQNSIPNFSVEVISANKYQGKNKILKSILDEYESLTSNL